MPDPKLYLLAMAASAIASLLFVLVATAVARPASSTRLNVVSILAISIGLAVGYNVLSLRLAWPPANGLDRLLLIIVPVAIGIELIAGFSWVPRSIVRLMRICLAAAAPRILLHGSVYLSGPSSDRDLWQSAVQLVFCSLLLIGTWRLLTILSARLPGISIPLALAMTIQCAGLNRSGRVIRRLVHRPIFRPPFNRLCTDADAGTNLTMDLRNALSETSKAVARRIAQIIVGRHSIGGRAGPCKTRL